MKYRKLSESGDYVFGHNKADFFIDVPEAVAQAIETRLLLIEGEWFLDITRGTPYYTKVLGTGTKPQYDLAIQQVILTTPGVESLVEYSSFVNETTRHLTIEATVNTIYGQSTLSIQL